MSSDAPESAQHDISVLLYRAILSVCALFIAWGDEWRSENINLEEAVVPDCDRFIVSSCVLPLVLRYFFSNLVGMLASVKC